MNTFINSFVVRLGKICADAISLYIDMERKRGKKFGQNITNTKLDFDQLKKEKKY